MPPSVAARIQNSPNVIPQAALIDQRNGKPKRVPKWLQTAIRLIHTGECTTVSAAAERVNVTRTHLSRCLSMPHVQVFIAQQRARELDHMTMRATARLGELMESKSDHVAGDITKHVLAIKGISPPSERHGVQVNVNVTPGYIVKLRHAADAQVIDGEAINVDTAAIDNKGK